MEDIIRYALAGYHFETSIPQNRRLSAPDIRLSSPYRGLTA
ncbi:hypothetical protein ACOJBO_37200 [Rhizobium beringeri]|jgi:hypothetical protein